MKKCLERCRSAGFQPATPLNSIEAGKMLALHWASRRLFHQPLRGSGVNVLSNTQFSGLCLPYYQAYNFRLREQGGKSG